MPARTSLVRVAVGLSAVAFGTVGCRGIPSEKPPIHLQQNMDFQQRFDPQEPNPMFEDGRAMRLPPEGTVPVGWLMEDDHLWRGRGPDGRLVDALPPGIKLDRKLLDRGQERFNIYCAPCHDHLGTGRGMATRRGGGFAVQPKNLHEPRLAAMPLGYFYKVITDGQGTMLSYAAQIPVEDRWAIAAWVRTLQASQRASASDVPEEARNRPVPKALAATRAPEGGAS
ncbi:MAG: cytochrome c [Deltaproteobacteria bacterium]|nr:MAG: cytochrome c [Deltaproteobacteria bacterium]